MRLGSIVLYTLTADDATQVMRRRTTGESIAARLAHSPGGLAPAAWPRGAQAHLGNPVAAGETYALVITRIWPDTDAVNGQVLLDGTDVLWVTSVHSGQGPGTYA